MTPEQMDRAGAHIIAWVDRMWPPARAWLRAEADHLVVTLQRAEVRAEITVETDDREAINEGLSHHAGRVHRRCNGQGVPIEGRAGDGRWRREVA